LSIASLALTVSRHLCTTWPLGVAGPILVTECLAGLLPEFSVAIRESSCLEGVLLAKSYIFSFGKAVVGPSGQISLVWSSEIKDGLRSGGIHYL
jgi:hypothetical protein